MATKLMILYYRMGPCFHTMQRTAKGRYFTILDNTVSFRDLRKFKCQNLYVFSEYIICTFISIGSVNKESLFQYGDELSYLNYSHPEFVPMFTDEVDTGRLNEAIQKCGSNASKACIADYLATGDIALAKVSGDKEHDSKSDVATIG